MLLHGTNQFAAAKPVEKFFADSVRIDEMREFENSMGVVLSYQDRRPSCDLGSNRSDWNAKMSKSGVKFLSIRDGANLQLVDDARAFRGGFLVFPLRVQVVHFRNLLGFCHFILLL